MELLIKIGVITIIVAGAGVGFYCVALIGIDLFDEISKG